MAFKPGEEDKEYSLDSLSDLHFNQEKFIGDVFNNKYILVIGSEVILDTSVEPTGDACKYILRNINDRLPRKFNNFDEIKQYYNKERDPIRYFLTKNKESMVLDDISKELQGLLRTKLFKFVVTTTFDSYLEILMRDIWGDRLRVVNIWDQSSLASFCDEIEGLKNHRHKDNSELNLYSEPTLIYAFGKCVEKEGIKYACEDYDYILTIERWMSLDLENKFLKFIQSKRLLSLGCKFDDWYFRFFWYILRRNKEKQQEGEIAIVFDEKDRSDRNLQKYLFNTRIVTHGNARVFMQEITKAFTSETPDNPYRDVVLRYRRQGEIFFSYSNKDKKTAVAIFREMSPLYPNLWFDQEKLLGGDNYDADIQYGIEHAKIFIPLLTENVANDLKNGINNNYYNKEWSLAAKRKQDLAIIPLATKGYSLRDSYHTDFFEKIIGKSVTGIDMTDPDAFDNLQKALDKHLNN